MSVEVITILMILLSSQLGFIYGFFTILIRRRPLYLKMAVLAMSCLMVGCIYILLQYITKGNEPDVFHVGMLGILGCFLFLFSANYGMIDSLADDGSRAFFKYRAISWLAPLVIILLYAPVFMIDGFMNKSISYFVVVLFIALASRFHFKHLIFPDVDYGVVRAIRGYNAVALVLCVAMTVYLGADLFDKDPVKLVAAIIISACCLIIIPLLKKEATKWTTA